MNEPSSVERERSGVAPLTRQAIAALEQHHEQLLQRSLDDLSSSDLLPESDLLAGFEWPLRQLEMLRRAGESQAFADEQPGADDPDATSGVIGRFRVIRELGRGGLGMVLLAHDPLLNRLVALKLPRPEAMITPGLRRRFQREGQAAARLTHPNIVPVYEVGEIGPICYIASAYIEGETLAQWTARRTTSCSPRLAARLVADLAEAMHYAHSQQVLHRDLKPGNILLERDAGMRPRPSDSADNCAVDELTPKVTDFGLAKVLDAADEETWHGAMLGTLNYMSPEQARGDLKKIGPASDIYSLGAILYELLTGHGPYPAATEADVLALLLSSAEPAAPQVADHLVPRDLQAICLRSLEKTPTRRYANAAALALDLRRFLAGEPTEARPLSAPQRLTRWSRRQPAVACLLAVIFSALALLAAGAGWHSRTLNKALDLAQANAERATSNKLASEQHERRAKEQLYAAEIRLADLAIRDGDLDRADRLLRHYARGTRLADLRGMEWFVLRDQLAWMRNEGDQCATEILPHPTEMYTAQFSPDARLLYTGGQDGQLRVWEHSTGELLNEINAHAACLNALRVSVDGTRLASAGCDNAVVLWALSADEPPRELRRFSHVEPVRRVAFSPDRRRVACMTAVDYRPNNVDGGMLHVYDVESGQRLHTTPALIQGFDWSPDGRYLLASGFGLLRVLRTSDWQVHRERAVENALSYLFTSPDAITYLDYPSGLFRYEIEADTTKFVMPYAREGMLAWDAKSQLLGILGENTVARLFDLRNANRPVTFFTHNRSRIGEVSFSPDGRFLACAGFDQRVCVTELTQWFAVPRSVQRAEVTRQGYAPAEVDPDGRTVTYLDSTGDTVCVAVDWSRPVESKPASESGRREASVAEQRVAIKRRFAPGRQRIEQTDDSRLWIHDLDVDRKSPLPIELAEKVDETAIVERELGAVFYGGRLRVVDLKSMRTIRDAPYDDRPTSEGHQFAASPDKRWLAISSNPGGLHLLDLKQNTARLLRPSHEVGVGLCSPVVSRDGRYVAVIERASKVFVWETETARLVHTLMPTESPGAIAFSPDARTLAIGTKRELQFWHLGTEQCMAGITLPRAIQLQYSSDGSELLCLTRREHTAELYRWNAADED